MALQQYRTVINDVETIVKLTEKDAASLGDKVTPWSKSRTPSNKSRTPSNKSRTPSNKGGNAEKKSSPEPAEPAAADQ